MQNKWPRSLGTIVLTMSASPLLAQMKLFAAGFLLVGLLACSRMAHALPQNPPPGPYHASCRSDSMNGTTLVATCKDFFGNFRTSNLPDAAKCQGTSGSIWNVNGDLSCVVAYSLNGPRGLAAYDIISILSDVTTAGKEKKIIRIDQPNVWSSAPEGDVVYPITFKPGDTIRFEAGGCVQTGGFGSHTWKDYVRPLGDNANNYYAGTAWIPGVTPGGLQRILGLMGDPKNPKEWPVPVPRNPELAKQYVLHLGYQDDNRSDNGYWNHDDGNDNQCKGKGPAWVDIIVVSEVGDGGKTPHSLQGSVWSPHSRPFDVVWDINNEDFNGLPLNPEWAFQLDNRDVRPDFNQTCGPAISGDSNIDIGKLAALCTSQAPTTDLFSSPAAHAKCPSDPLKGHMNWTIATMTGQVRWLEWSGYWPWDDDFNMVLIRPGNEGQTVGNVQFGGTVVEFDAEEVIDNVGSPWWNTLEQHARKLPTSGLSDPSTLMGGTAGLSGVVTGLFGIDGVHQSYVEVHPVFAIALRVKQAFTKDSIQENWAFFVRNQGDEGACSSDIHVWPTPTGDFFVQLPWPDGITTPPTVDTSQTAAWEWTAAGITGSVLQPEAGWTVMKFHFPTTESTGVDGMLTLNYQLPAERKSPPRKAAVAQSINEAGQRITDTPEIEWEDVAQSMIKDAGTRAQFMKDLSVLKPPGRAVRSARSRIAMDMVIQPHKHVPGPASRGQLTRTHTIPNQPKLKLDAEAEKVVQKYQNDLRMTRPTAIVPKPAEPSKPK